MILRVSTPTTHDEGHLLNSTLMTVMVMQRQRQAKDAIGDDYDYEW
jgi:hypothetical protein